MMLSLNIFSYNITNCSYTVSVQGGNPIDIGPSNGRWAAGIVNFTYENPNNYRSQARFEIGCKTRDGVKCPGPLYVIYGHFKECQGRNAS